MDARLKNEVFSSIFGPVEKVMHKITSYKNTDRTGLDLRAFLHQSLSYSLGVVESFAVLSGIPVEQVNMAFNEMTKKAKKLALAEHSNNCSGCKEEGILMSTQQVEDDSCEVTDSKLLN